MNEGKALYVNTLNYNANDLTELRKLSDSNPELAHKIVDNQDRRNQREANSYRIALMVAGFVALALVAGGSLGVFPVWRIIHHHKLSPRLRL